MRSDEVGTQTVLSLEMFNIDAFPIRLLFLSV